MAAVDAHDAARWKRRPRKLRDLVELTEHLDRKIQEGEHGSVEDATAAMDLYKLFAADCAAQRFDDRRPAVVCQA